MRRRFEVEIFLQQIANISSPLNDWQIVFAFKAVTRPGADGIVAGMSVDKFRRSWRPSLGVQILALLLGGLIVAQAVTVVLIVLIPPEPRPQYELDDIAAVLGGFETHTQYARPLQRIVQSDPPILTGPGWLVSESARHDLAALAGKSEGDVLVYFYTPPPFAGTVTVPPRESALERPPRESALQPASPDAAFSRTADATPQGHGRKAKSNIVPADFVMLAQAGPPGGMPPGGLPGQGIPPGGFFRPPMPGSGLIGRTGRGTPFGGGAPGGRGAIIDNTKSTADIQSPIGVDPSNRIQHAPELGAPAPLGLAESPIGFAPSAQSSPRSVGGPAPAIDHAEFNARAGAMQAAPMAPVSRSPTVLPSKPAVPAPPPVPADLTPPATGGQTAIRAADPPAVRPVPAETPAPAAAAPELKLSSERPSPLASQPLRAASIAAMDLPGFGAAPFIQGDFVAALKLDDNHWAIVRPMQEGFPNSWQRRVLLWFLISFALVAPFGWLFARRVVRPIAGFADAAEQLGRDPHAPILALDGPSEIGRAAHAFNRMQNRLRSFVDDRTAMMGAISHDLRTPLTRMRFRLEDAPDDIREGMEQEVAEMEAMINSVLAFIRDASEPGVRERLDLRTIVEDVVEDAVFVGNDVTLEHSEAASVEVDVLGMRRLLGNLVENAVKYGEHARVRLFRDHNDAIAEISDDGPGLPEDELERVFQPFYRGANARSSKKDGNGLGLAVCRSIARAHGGDVRLIRSAQGFVAQLRVPLAELQG
jgi:signal transduction histidine kinase